MAMLKIEMPAKCADCPLSFLETDREYESFSCYITGNLLAIEGEQSLRRDEECPLQEELLQADLYDLYEKYCLESCLERQTYEPYHRGKVGQCPNCQIDSFISCVQQYEKYKNIHEDDIDVTLLRQNLQDNNKESDQREDRREEYETYLELLEKRRFDEARRMFLQMDFQARESLLYMRERSKSQREERTCAQLFQLLTEINVRRRENPTPEDEREFYRVRDALEAAREKEIERAKRERSFQSTDRDLDRDR